MMVDHTCEYLSCNKTPALGSIYCHDHEQREKIKPARTFEERR